MTTSARRASSKPVETPRVAQLSNADSEESPLLPNGSRLGTSPADDEDAPDLAAWPGATDFTGLPWWKRPSVYWLLPGFFIYALAFGGIVIPRLDLILNLVCREYQSQQQLEHPDMFFAPVILGDSNPQCSQNKQVQKLATKFNLYVSLITGILNALSSPKLGSLSDRYGRKLLLAVTVFGGLTSEIIHILAAAYPDAVNYRWILLAGVLDGICGSFIAGMAITHSYASDCTAPPRRAIVFGYFHACLFGGIAVGPFLGAAVVKFTGGGLLTVFFSALACHAAFLLYLLFIVPESLPKKRQLAAREQHQIDKQAIADADLNRPSGSFTTSAKQHLKSLNLLEPLKILWPTGEGSSPQVRMNLVLLSAVDAIIFGVAMGAVVVIIYYAKFRFEWDDVDSQLFIGCANIVRVSSLVIALPLLNYVFRTRKANRLRRESGVELVERNSGSDNLDLNTIRASLAFEVTGFLLYSAAKVGHVFFIGGLIASFGGMGGPILQAALTKHVPHDRVGQVLGATGLLHAFGRVVCPVIFSAIYYGTIETRPETVFIVLTVCFIVALILSFFIKPHVYLEEAGPHHSITSEERERLEREAERIGDEEIVGR